MLILSFTDVLTVQLAAPATTVNPNFYVSFYDSTINGGVTSYGDIASTSTNGTSPINVVPPPPNSTTSRNVSTFLLLNTDTAPITATIAIGGSPICKVTLAVGDLLSYSKEASCFSVTDLNGSFKQTVSMQQVFVAAGKLLSIGNTLTFAGTDGTTFTFPATSATIARIDNAQTFLGTQTFSGLLTPASAVGIKGTILADNPLAGSVGEVVTSTVAAAAAITLVSVTGANVTSIALTAGDWDIDGSVAFTLASTTTMGYLSGGINTVSATLPVNNAGVDTITGAGTNATIDITVDPVRCIPRVRVNMNAALTTVYLVGKAKFGVSTCKAYGTIYARRVR